MNFSTFKIASIDRIIAHEIHAKTEEKDAIAKTNSALLRFKKAEKDILVDRILGALKNTTKTFQLDYEDKSEDSIYHLLKTIKKQTDKQFISSSISLANSLADAHFRTKIPGGYCLIGNGVTSTNRFFLFIIKAELQEVFNVNNNELTLIKDVFLSPAKDFYKIGFFVEGGNSFIPFMYDDQFSLQKKDLTEYFYGTFLGLTTDKNDRLKAKNFYEDTKVFIEANVDDVHDRLGLIKALNVLYREDTKGLISPKEFSDQYFEGELKAKFEKKIVNERYPLSFTKDISLIESRLELQRISIPLAYTMTIVGSTSELDSLEIIEGPSKQTIKELEPQINKGQIRKMVIVKQT
ncbi:MAG: nucleoid-associated protein [Cyclobacteriaceae bacterium]|nr:nucleoid-associated protein [Cyclobacteriaceae bacterium]